MISRKFWNANSDLKIACLQHPFVQGIATGTLPLACFRYYVGQDAFFLTAFGRAYSIAAAKTPDWEGFTTFHGLGEGVIEELRLHQRYAAEWGVNLQQIQPGLATRRYTDFLLATAWGQDVGLVTAAMTPCLRLYAFLAQSLAQPQIREHQYSDWIKTYNDAAFEKLAQQLEDLMNRYITHQEAEGSLIYRYAMECERDFFEAAWCSQSSYF